MLLFFSFIYSYFADDGAKITFFFEIRTKVGQTSPYSVFDLDWTILIWTVLDCHFIMNRLRGEQCLQIVEICLQNNGSVRQTYFVHFMVVIIGYITQIIFKH